MTKRIWKLIAEMLHIWNQLPDPFRHPHFEMEMSDLRILNFDEESVVHEDRVTSVWWAALVYRATGEVFDHVMS